MSTDLQLLKTSQVAELLNVDRTTLWKWYTKGRFPRPVKVGGTSRFRRSEVEAWIASRSPVAARSAT